MTYEKLILERKGRVGIITFNRPKSLNALCDALIADLGKATDELEADAEIRVIVVTGGTSLRSSVPSAQPSRFGQTGAGGLVLRISARQYSWPTISAGRKYRLPST